MLVKKFALVGALMMASGGLAACAPAAAGQPTAAGSSPPTSAAVPSDAATGSPSAAGGDTTAAGGSGGGSGTTTGGTGDGGGGTTAGGLRQCRLATGLAVALGKSDAGVTHRSITLVFTNTGSGPCQLTGYPGVAALNGAGAQIAQAKRTLSGYLGGAKGIASITIAHGQSAAAVVEASAATPDGKSCTGYAGLVVTAPDDTRSTKLSWVSDACTNLEVHPVTAGGS